MPRAATTAAPSGRQHPALRATSRAAVAALYRKLAAIGANVLEAPAEHRDYRVCYCAVFFADPEGVKLEHVFTPEASEVGVAHA